MITAKDYKPSWKRDKTTVTFMRDTVVSEKELEKLYVDVGGKEIKFLEWIKQMTMRGEE